MSRAACPWCAVPYDQAPEYPDEDTLCRPHLAELYCTTVAELDREEREQAYDLL